MKRLFAAVLVAVVVLSAISCNRTVYVCEICSGTVQKEDQSCPSCGAVLNIPESDANGITYHSITLDEIYQEYQQNAARAQEMYLTKYVCIEGTVRQIAEKNCFEIVDRDTDELLMSYSMVYASCKTAGNHLVDTILGLNKNDNVVIKGKIVSISTYVFMNIEIVVDSIIVEAAE